MSKSAANEIKKNDLKDIYANEQFKNEVDNAFSNDKIYIYNDVGNLLNDAGIEKKFNDVFLAREPPIDVGNDDKKVYFYRDEKGVAINLQKQRVSINRQNRSIIIVCTACVIEEEDEDNKKIYKIVIAPRLDTKHNEDKKNIEEKKMEGGIISWPSKRAKDIFMYIKNSLIDNIES